MTTSEYLQVQTDLLIAFRLIRLARVEEALQLARASSVAARPLVDQWGSAVATDPERMAVLCEGALALLEQTGREIIPRKPAASESVAVAREACA